MRKLKRQTQKSIRDFSSQETLTQDQLKQVKGGDDPTDPNGEIVTHEDVVEV